jgi:prepilin-type N-terminal cleavage/methylation domain-containing protein
MPCERRAGFTLLEVVIALFLVTTVLSLVVQFVTDNLRALADVRQELEVAQLSEARMRGLYARAVGGAPPEIGSSSGSFDAPNEEMRWEMEVEAYQLPLPDDLDPEERARIEQLSTVFAPLTPGGAAAQSYGRQGAAVPSVRRVIFHVFREDTEPQEFDAFTLFTVDPPDLSDFVPEEEETPEEERDEAEEEAGPESGGEEEE